MPAQTAYIRRDLSGIRSIADALDYIQKNNTDFLSWKTYINHLVDINGGKYTRFAAKTGFSKNTIKKWCKDGAKPQNRNDFIRLAFGANLSLEQTNHLLKKYGSYAELYPKDLYDAVVIYVLRKRQDDFDDPGYNYESVEIRYEALGDIRQEAYEAFKKTQNKISRRQTLNTMLAYRELTSLTGDAEFEHYVMTHKEVFLNTYDKLIRFIDDFLKIREDEYNECRDADEQRFSLHALAQEKGLNSSFESALSQLRTKRVLPKRSKLIVIGVLLNMVEADINTMLRLANMSELYARDSIDALMIFLLNRAVQENPELEYNNAQRYLFNGSDLRLKAQYRKSVEEYYNTEFGEFNDDLDDIFTFIRQRLDVDEAQGETVEALRSFFE